MRMLHATATGKVHKTAYNLTNEKHDISNNNNNTTDDPSFRPLVGPYRLLQRRSLASSWDREVRSNQKETRKQDPPLLTKVFPASGGLTAVLPNGNGGSMAATTEDRVKGPVGRVGGSCPDECRAFTPNVSGSRWLGR